MFNGWISNVNTPQAFVATMITAQSSRHPFPKIKKAVLYAEDPGSSTRIDRSSFKTLSKVSMKKAICDSIDQKIRIF
jgi:hypothetical protein